MVDGHQTTSCVEGWKEQHISLDVALAVWEAASAAGNPAFTREEAWPVLRGVSEWIGARGVWTARGFEIHNSTCTCLPVRVLLKPHTSSAAQSRGQMRVSGR